MKTIRKWLLLVVNYILLLIIGLNLGELMARRRILEILSADGWEVEEAWIVARLREQRTELSRDGCYFLLCEMQNRGDVSLNLRREPGGEYVRLWEVTRSGMKRLPKGDGG